MTGIDWSKVERLIRRCVTAADHGCELSEAQENLLYRAIAADTQRYRALHERVKREEMAKLNPWTDED